MRKIIRDSQGQAEITFDITFSLYRNLPKKVLASRLTEPVEIETLEGVMIGNAGDWLIRGVNGEYYPCKHDIFLKTYEPA